MKLKSKEEITKIHCDERPNRYNIMALSAIVGLLLLFIVFNYLGIIDMDSSFINMSGAISIISYLIVLLFATKETVGKKFVKYLIMAVTLLMIFLLYIILNIHATLGLLIPIMLSTQYSSRKLTMLTIAGTIAIAIIGPVVSYRLGTFSLAYFYGFIDTIFGFNITATVPSTLTESQSITRILQYLSMPSAIIVAAIGLIAIALADNNKESLLSQLEVVDLSEKVNDQLEHETEIKERMLASMSDIIESRDVTTGSHVRRSVEALKIILDEMVKDEECAVDEQFAKLIIKAAPMHDLGKIAISDEILNKPDSLSEEEYEIIKTHPIKSQEIIITVFKDIMENDLFQVAKNIALYHHEKYDGTGYPKGLSGEYIPLEARIMALADVYDALVSERSYKHAYSFKEAEEYMRGSVGTHFDPKLYPYFEKCRSEIEKYYIN